MNLKNNAKKAAKRGAELLAAKKGLQWTASILKWGAIAGAGYLGYKYYRKNEDTIRDKLSRSSVNFKMGCHCKCRFSWL